MSEKEKEELRGSVGRILEFFDREFGMKARGPVAVEFTTQAEMLAQAESEAEREDEGRRRSALGSELLMKKAGFVPRDFDLQRWRRESSPRMRLAYYNHESKKLYLLDTLARGQREAVLVHELMHAVEDQHVDLGAYMRGGTEERAILANLHEERYDPTFDDGVLARQTVIEGHAMFATYQYLYSRVQNAPHTRDYSFRQDFQRQMDLAFPSLGKETRELLQRTPEYIRRILEFPYWTGGFAFVQELNTRGGGKLAFRKPLEQPPSSTREILMPAKFAEGEPVPRLALPKLRPILGKEHRLLRVETAGQFDVLFLVEQQAGRGKAERLAAKWRGGVWQIFTRSAAEKPAAGEVELVYVSQWQDAKAAEDFAAVYAKAVRKKYRAAGAPTRAGHRLTWQTDEGTVTVEASGDRVLVLESFDDAAAEKLRAALLGGAAASR